MKHLENFKFFESGKQWYQKSQMDSDLESIEDSFIDITQRGYYLKIDDSHSSLKLNFPPSGVIRASNISNFSNMKNTVDVIQVEIKKENDGNEFKLEDITENFELVESVTKSLGYKLEWIYIGFTKSVGHLWNYYSSFEKVESWLLHEAGSGNVFKPKFITVAFSKK